VARVPAKINLSLRVGRPRDDGFHPLATVYQAVSLYDEVSATLADPGTFEVHTVGEGAGDVPDGSANLAIKAARLLAKKAPEPVGAYLKIKKSIPVAAGLAGGSADAAATLLACSLLWDLDLGVDELQPLAAKLGSDVPFALVGGTAVGGGRGENVMPALSRGSYHWVLGIADRGLATPKVFGRFDDLEIRPPGPLDVGEPLMNALLRGDPGRLGEHLVNDLQRPALDLMPELSAMLRSGRDHGALGAVLSGSGPTCAFLAADESTGSDLVDDLAATGLFRAVRLVTGPVPGARILP
jgi:4-diphosphocytidyl-2-C-methyl-D-erythritol kinase